MYFFRKIIFNFPSKEENIILSVKKILSFQVIQCDFFGKTIFSEHLKKISYFHVVFGERLSLIFCIKNKIIFSGKRCIIFPDNTRKMIFWCNFFEKTISSEHLEKGNMFFCAVSCFCTVLFNGVKCF